MVKMIKWTASNMTSGETPCVYTTAGWTAEDGSVYGWGPTDTLFGVPPNPPSARVMARVRRELKAAAFRHK